MCIAWENGRGRLRRKQKRCQSQILIDKTTLLALLSVLMIFTPRGCPCTACALCTHCVLLLDQTPPEEPPSTPLPKALKIR